MMRLDELFTIKNGIASTGLNIEYSKQLSHIPYIRPASTQQRTLAGWVWIGDIEDNNIYPEETLFVSTNGEGSHSYSYVSSFEFVPNSDVSVLIPKREMTLLEKIYYARCITKNRYRFSYGRKPKGKRLAMLNLPDKMPDEFKTVDIKSIIANTNKAKDAFSHANETNNKKETELKFENWSFFSLQDIFIITGSKTTPLLELNEYGIGKYPYVTTKATNNGVDGFFDYWTEQGGVLTLDSAVIGYCSYQEHNFSASDHVEKLIPQFEMNKYIALFLATIINKEQYRFGYGRKCSQSRLKQLKIKLPIKNNQPDWYFMENYIKSLPYSASI